MKVLRCALMALAVFSFSAKAESLVRISSSELVDECLYSDYCQRLYCLKARFPIRKISFDYSSARPGALVSACESDYSGRVFSYLASTALSPEIVPEPRDAYASSVLIDVFPCPSDLKVTFWTTREAWDQYLQIRELDAAVLLGPRDEDNPLRLTLTPVTQFHRQLAELLVAESGAVTDLEKAVAFMNYITWFDVGYPYNAKATGVLLEQVGACGTFQFAFQALATSLGMKTRALSLYNYPPGNGHSVCECQIDGKWVIFDPTYGAYYKNRETGALMSFDDLRNPANCAQPVYLNAARYADSAERTGWGTQRVYLNAFPAGVIGPDHPMYFPLPLDLNDNPSVTLPDLDHQGGDYLGAAMLNANHDWVLTGLTAGERYCLCITPSRIGGNAGLKEFTFDVHYGNAIGKDEKITVTRTNLGKIELPFVAQGDSAVVALTHDYRGPDFWYLSIDRVDLFEKPPLLRLVSESPWSIVGHGVSVALSEGGGYAAFKANDEPTEFVLAVEPACKAITLGMEFYADNAYATDWEVLAEGSAGEVLAKTSVSGAAAVRQQVTVRSPGRFSRLRFRFFDYAGKRRLLLRKVSVISASGYADAERPPEFTIEGGVLKKCRLNGSSEVIVPKGVTEIAARAFSGCTDLFRVSLPGGLREIGDYCFASCANLASVKVPSGVTKIGDGAFYKCSSLATVSLPSSLKQIGAHCFNSCRALETVKVPGYVTSVGESAFSGCTALTSAYWSKSAAAIGKKTFYNCSTLTDITLPVGVKAIGANAFSGCRKLTEIKRPSSLKTIDSTAFKNSGVRQP